MINFLNFTENIQYPNIPNLAVFVTVLYALIKKAGKNNFPALNLRSLADLNRRKRFCRPLPNPSAKRPNILDYKITKKLNIKQ